MSTPLTDFMPRVMPFAPGCAEPTAEQYVREAAIDFCKRTKAWREVNEFQIDADMVDIVCVPPSSELHEIETMWFDDRELKPVAWPTVWQDTGAGTPRTFTQIGLDTIRIDPPGAGRLRMSMWLRPSQDADTVPSFLLHQFAQAIADGALARILMLPAKPYYSPQTAMAFAAAFERQCDTNFDLSLRGQQRAPVRTRASFF